MNGKDAMGSNFNQFILLSDYFHGRTEENVENVSQFNRCPGQESNSVSPEYESVILNTEK
jgi:hypothetical protein